MNGENSSDVFLRPQLVKSLNRIFLVIKNLNYWHNIYIYNLKKNHMTTSKLSTLCLGLAFVGSTLFFTNCKKNEKDPEPTPTPTPAPAPTNTEKLTGKNFKLTASTVEPSIGGISDLYLQMSDCQKDDILRFDTPNIFKDDEGPTKCATNDPQTTTGTWVWNTDETILTTSTSNETTSFSVLTNDGTTLKVKYTEKINNTNYAVTLTYVKQ